MDDAHSKLGLTMQQLHIKFGDRIKASGGSFYS